MWVRGLKPVCRISQVLEVLSHPMWVRGLKPLIPMILSRPTRVAPYVGAWIETLSFAAMEIAIKSHPMWVRGLKLMVLNLYLQSLVVAPYVGAWIETGR